MKVIKSLIIFSFPLLLAPNYVMAGTVNNTVVLRQGVKGTKVEKLQKKLNKYLDCDLEVDGVFGGKTLACVVKFQDLYGLSIDGVVGAETWEVLTSKDTKVIDDNSLEVEDGENIIVTSSEAVVRSGAGDEYDSVEEVSRGDIYNYVSTVKVDGEKWYQVEDEEAYGYVSSDDVSKNFIVVDISDQKLIYFNNKKVVLDASVVTGMKGKHDTPVGHYILRVGNKETNRTLRGYNDNGTQYASFVNYWMPFITDRGIGFHDAGWRGNGEYTNYTYINDGSHGCVNMKYEDAKDLYKKLKKDTDVIIRK